jgi:hypothetical protein
MQTKSRLLKVAKEQNVMLRRFALALVLGSSLFGFACSDAPDVIQPIPAGAGAAAGKGGAPAAGKGGAAAAGKGGAAAAGKGGAAVAGKGGATAGKGGSGADESDAGVDAADAATDAEAQ